MDENIKIGDWVRSYGSGIWRVHRILELNDFDIPSQSYKPRTVVFSSRFVNDSYKRSFSTECCDLAFVSLLDSDEKDELDSFIENNPELVAKFDTYKPKSIDAIYNASASQMGQAQFILLNLSDRLNGCLMTSLYIYTSALSA
ncbi:hypothetical protein [Pseudoalteromonas luteoviolacea]|uniref:hypothetical protein n=1 Tax=Pseudoalteromonas luteoviolacea TaxID=43657 RepID=UPI000A810D71|nr:hypothetical protein [Pseudoalteromonas luteoviolacea]